MIQALAQSGRSMVPFFSSSNFFCLVLAAASPQIPIYLDTFYARHVIHLIAVEGMISVTL